MASGTRGASMAEPDADVSTRRTIRKRLTKVGVFSLSSTVLIAVHLRRTDPLFLGKVFALTAAVSVAGLLVVLFGAHVGE